MIHRGSNDLHFRQIITLLRRRQFFVAMTVLFGGGAAVILALSLSPYYTAKAQLLYQAEGQVGTERSDDAAVDTLVEMLNSPGHLRRLAMSLQANPHPSETGMQDGAPEQDAAPKVVSTAPPPILSYQMLDKGLNVYKERQSRLVAVTFRSTEPATAALVANRAVELYLDHEADFQREARARSLRSIADRMQDALARIDQAEGALREHKIQYGLADVAGSDPTDRQIGELTRQRMIARSDLIARDAQLNSLRAQKLGAAEGAADTTTGYVRVAETDQTGKTVADATPLMADVPEPKLKQLTLGRDAVAARLSDIENRLTTLQDANAKTTDAWIRLRELEREANAAGQSYENLLRQKDDLQGLGSVRPSVRVVSMAEVPDLPSSPNPLLFVAPALLASLLIGGFLAVLFERLDQRLRSERDVEATLDAPCIGMVPSISGPIRATLSQLLHNEPYAPYTEAIRSVYVAATRGAAQTILVTASAVGEGSTTLVLSLAAFAERLGQRVLVIDFDLRHPELLQLLGEGNSETLPNTETAPPEQPLQMTIRTAKNYGIDYLTLPRLQVDPLTLLASEDFPSLLKELQRNYDCILIDTAPVVGATETRLLAAMVDRVLFTVRWGVTEAGAALAAVQHLRASGTAQSIPISVVVNKVDLAVHERGGYSQPVQMTHAQG